MLAKPRRILLAARLPASPPYQPIPEEIHAIRLTRENAVA